MPVVSYNTRGFADKYFNVKKIAATGGKTFMFVDVESVGETDVSFMQIKRALSSRLFSEDGFIIFDIFYTKTGTNVAARIFSNGLSTSDIKFFKSGTRLYYQVNSVGGYAFFLGANVNVSEVTLPDDAVEISIE